MQAVLIWPILQFTSYRTDQRRSVPVPWVLNHWINRLISAKGQFPIPIRVTGSELIHNLFRNPTGAAVCSGHVPLLDPCLQALMDMGCPPAGVIAIPEGLIDSRFPVWSKPALPGIPSGPTVLIKVRTVLRNGGFVAALVDLDFGKAYSPNLFRLIRLTRAKVVFVIPELRPNGDIEVEFFLPPDPSCQTEQSILQNLQVLQSRVDRVLGRTPPSEKPIAAVSSLARDPPGYLANGQTWVASMTLLRSPFGSWSLSRKISHRVQTGSSESQTGANEVDNPSPNSTSLKEAL